MQLEQLQQVLGGKERVSDAVIVLQRACRSSDALDLGQHCGKEHGLRAVALGQPLEGMRVCRLGQAKRHVGHGPSRRFWPHQLA